MPAVREFIFQLLAITHGWKKKREDIFYKTERPKENQTYFSWYRKDKPSLYRFHRLIFLKNERVDLLGYMSSSSRITRVQDICFFPGVIIGNS
jgi:hypothetical protein